MELENLARAALDAWEWDEGSALYAHMDKLRKYLKQQDCYRADHEDTIEAAAYSFEIVDVNIAEPPLVILSEGGLWVSAWVWVSTEGEDE